jgi:hypothetical protein
MADINIERKRRSVVPLLLTLLTLAAIAVAAWLYLDDRNGVDADSAPAAEVQTSPDYAPAPAPATTGY